MAEPSRKKVKGIPTNVFDIGTAKEDTSLVFETNHPKKSITIDLREFSTGTENRALHPLIQNRFKGRDTLIRQLAPFIKRQYAQASQGNARNLIPALRTWWCLFDKYEDEVTINTLVDIDDFCGYLQVKEGVDKNQKGIFLRIVNQAREAGGFAKLYWTSNEASQNHEALPPFSAVKLIYDELKHHMAAVIARWERADELSAAGRDWSLELRKRHSRLHGFWQEAETHATYRGAIKILNNACPSGDALGALLNTPRAEAVRNRAIAIAGLYPSRLDTQYLLFLFMLKTGWNALTALAIDVEDYLYHHPTSTQHHIVHATKNRGNTEQFAIGLNKSQRSPGGILKILIERTTPLRGHLKNKLKELEKKLEDKKHSHIGTTDTTECLEEVKSLREMIRTPWLFGNIKTGIGRLAEHDYFHLAHEGRRGTGLQFIIEKVNYKLESSKRINEDITLTDLRDSYIAFAYQTSGYSWLVAKLAAGHKSIESLVTYLRKRQWKAHGEQQVVRFSEALWNEIRIHRRVDPAVLFALVQRGKITEEERARLASRTYVGTGCKDFKNPPRSIAPEHQKGHGCRVQRCTLCPTHAILFDDSYDLLSRRLVELIYIKTTIPLQSWMESSFPLEFESTEAALARYDVNLVKEKTAFWQKEIEDGRHIPVCQEGTY